jgi:hypothetical protein
MIERHYFRDQVCPGGLCACVSTSYQRSLRLQLVKSFDFTFGFCIPGSTNTWDSVYSLPPLSEELSKCLC